ncbi:serine hydrolase domain-containing protein [Aquimarina sp. 2201CG14-23]|uniref:serine hydrolase domain-containing protein n=1 Tax=Aquimarina mycalae TaxID=3040073 RepID=UPI0024782669|nr:serine hydrolase domain-containing protein [Aquimarina sp. 2201CG14-23]MDH7444805.1 serine hydrolase domain-containing protein [Aquimarina sp. 2201CG14-23]
MKIVKLIFILFLPIICFSQKSRLHTFINDSLDNYIEKGITEWKIPGLAIGIVKDGKLIFNKGYGHKSIHKHAPIDSNTLFTIGSLTKAITCASTVIVAEKDSLSLNDPIKKWLPEFSLKDENDTIIIEDILTGRTGLGSHKGDFLFWKTHLDGSDLMRILPHIKPETEVRRKFIYNNISYVLLNEIFLNATGKDWAETVATDFFTPLKMSNSYTSVSNIPVSSRVNLASPHLKHKSKILSIEEEKIENMGPAGSIVSTSTDISKWIIEFINDKGILPVSVKKRIRKPYQLKGYRTKKDNRNQLRFLFSGMGWNIFDEFDTLTYVHDGGTDGTKSYLMIIPEEQYGVIVLTNSRSHNFSEALIDELHYALMEEGFQNFSKDYLIDYTTEEKENLAEIKKIDVLIKDNSQKLSDRKKFIGTYSNPLYGNMSIVESNNQLQLILSQHQHNLQGKLDYIGDNNFWITFSLPAFSSTKIEFSIKDKKIEGFKYLAETSGDSNYWFKKND